VKICRVVQEFLTNSITTWSRVLLEKLSNIPSDRQEIPLTLFSTNVHYRVHNSLPSQSPCVTFRDMLDLLLSWGAFNPPPPAQTPS
jgi:hypothetical protein